MSTFFCMALYMGSVNNWLRAAADHLCKVVSVSIYFYNYCPENEKGKLVNGRGPITPYTPPLISPISIISTWFPLPPQYLLNPVNIYEFLLPPLISANTHYPLLIPTAWISTNSDNPHPISKYPTTPIHPG